LVDVEFNRTEFEAAAKGFACAGPFNHAVIDGFFPLELARALEAEFPPYDDPLWHEYDNPIEIKKTCNSWLAFPTLTYQAFSFLNSPAVTGLFTRALGLPPLAADPGLNGGGWHAHGPGGRLNPHLDYSIHPKLGLQRKLNLIIYLTEGWEDDWGGGLGLWAKDPATGGPGKLVKEVAPRFNRAVLFDTTQDSWHGMAQDVRSPPGVLRKSMAVYYLVQPPVGVDARGKALFAPTEAQKDDPAVRELIERRASVTTAAQVYRKGR
jgi:hypothetical protein